MQNNKKKSTRDSFLEAHMRNLGQNNKEMFATRCICRKAVFSYTFLKEHCRLVTPYRVCSTSTLLFHRLFYKFSIHEYTSIKFFPRIPAATTISSTELMFQLTFSAADLETYKSVQKWNHVTSVFSE